MNLIRYKPKSLVGWDRFFDDLFPDDIWGFDFRNPAVDVKEDDNQYTLEAELPGLTEKDIDVKVEDNILTISSKKEEKKEEKKDNYLIKERREYSFHRTFTLPKEVNKDKIDASFKNGLLKLVLPKAPEAKPKQIEVKAD